MVPKKTVIKDRLCRELHTFKVLNVVKILALLGVVMSFLIASLFALEAWVLQP